MTLAEKIPEMTDEQVINLLSNAERLQAFGDDKQKAAAAELLPVLQDVAAQRKAARLEATQAKRAAARRPRKVAA